MSDIAEIEAAIENLPAPQVDQLERWLEALRQRRDAATGGYLAAARAGRGTSRRDDSGREGAHAWRGMILFDTNVLLDIATADPAWLPWSEGPIPINPIIYSELAPAGLRHSVRPLFESSPNVVARGASAPGCVVNPPEFSATGSVMAPTLRREAGQWLSNRAITVEVDRR